MEQKSEFRYTREGRGIVCPHCGTGAQTKEVPCANCGGNVFETPTNEEVLETGKFLTDNELASLKERKPRKPRRAA